MQAIATTYRGTRFRSRLEADWAMTLDTRRITWQYEPEGYKLPDGTYYSPDFWLPGASAWLEVKGSHMQRVSKLHLFAATLWAESGCTSTYDLDSPMVLLGREPFHDGQISDLVGKPSISLCGVMGLGKAYSVATVTCPACDQGTVVALWQPHCRGCRHVFDDAHETWFDGVIDSYYRGFERVIRPAGRGL